MAQLAADLASSYVDGEGNQCRRNPSISLVVPADQPRRPALELALLPADYDSPTSAAAIDRVLDRPLRVT